MQACRGVTSVALRKMQYLVGILCVAMSGCATSLSAGTQGVIAPRDGASLEATVAGGLGMGGSKASVLAKLEGALGVAHDGGTQGRAAFGGEYMSFGHGRENGSGWQARGSVGGSFGAYQHNDPTVALSGGLHWDLSRDQDNDLVVTSLALELMLGYAFADEPGAAFFGIGLSFRRDSVHDIRWLQH